MMFSVWIHTEADALLLFLCDAHSADWCYRKKNAKKSYASEKHPQHHRVVMTTHISTTFCLCDTTSQPFRLPYGVHWLNTMNSPKLEPLGTRKNVRKLTEYSISFFALCTTDVHTMSDCELKNPFCGLRSRFVMYGAELREVFCFELFESDVMFIWWMSGFNSLPQIFPIRM